MKILHAKKIIAITTAVSLAFLQVVPASFAGPTDTNQLSNGTGVYTPVVSVGPDQPEAQTGIDPAPIPSGSESLSQPGPLKAPEYAPEVSAMAALDFSLEVQVRPAGPRLKVTAASTGMYHLQRSEDNVNWTTIYDLPVNTVPHVAYIFDAQHTSRAFYRLGKDMPAQASTAAMPQLNGENTLDSLIPQAMPAFETEGNAEGVRVVLLLPPTEDAKRFELQYQSGNTWEMLATFDTTTEESEPVYVDPVQGRDYRLIFDPTIEGVQASTGMDMANDLQITVDQESNAVVTWGDKVYNGTFVQSGGDTASVWITIPATVSEPERYLGFDFTLVNLVWGLTGMYEGSIDSADNVSEKTLTFMDNPKGGQMVKTVTLTNTTSLGNQWTSTTTYGYSTLTDPLDPAKINVVVASEIKDERYIDSLGVTTSRNFSRTYYNYDANGNQTGSVTVSLQTENGKNSYSASYELRDLENYRIITAQETGVNLLIKIRQFSHYTQVDLYALTRNNSYYKDPVFSEHAYEIEEVIQKDAAGAVTFVPRRVNKPDGTALIVLEAPDVLPHTPEDAADIMIQQDWPEINGYQVYYGLGYQDVAGKATPLYGLVFMKSGVPTVVVNYDPKDPDKNTVTLDDGREYWISIDANGMIRLESRVYGATMPFGDKTVTIVTATDLASNNVSYFARITNPDGTEFKRYLIDRGNYAPSVSTSAYGTYYTLVFKTLDGLRVMVQQISTSTPSSTVSETAFVNFPGIGDVNVTKSYSLKDGQLVKTAESYFRTVSVWSSRFSTQVSVQTTYAMVNGSLVRRNMSIYPYSYVGGALKYPFIQEVTYVDGKAARASIYGSNATSPADYLYFDGAKVSVKLASGARQEYLLSSPSITADAEGFVTIAGDTTVNGKNYRIQFDNAGKSTLYEYPVRKMALATYPGSAANIIVTLSGSPKASIVYNGSTYSGIFDPVKNTLIVSLPASGSMTARILTMTFTNVSGVLTPASFSEKTSYFSTSVSGGITYTSTSDNTYSFTFTASTTGGYIVRTMMYSYSSTSTSKDAAGKITTSTYSSNNRTLYNYTTGDKVASIVSSGSNTNNQVLNGTSTSRTDYTYDAAGRQTIAKSKGTYSYIPPTGTSSTSTYTNDTYNGYDAAGNPLGTLYVSSYSYTGGPTTYYASYTVQDPLNKRSIYAYTSQGDAAMMGMLRQFSDYSNVNKYARTRTLNYATFSIEEVIQKDSLGVVTFVPKRVQKGSLTYIISGLAGDSNTPGTIDPANPDSYINSRNGQLFKNWQTVNGYSVNYGVGYKYEGGTSIFVGYGLVFTKWDSATGKQITVVVDWPAQTSVMLGAVGQEIKYDIKLDAKGVLTLVKGVPDAVQALVVQLGKDLGSYKVTAALISGTEYRVSISPQDGAVFQQGQMRSMSFVVGPEGVLIRVEGAVVEGIPGVNGQLLYDAAVKMAADAEIQLIPPPGEAWRVVLANLLRVAGMIVTKVDASPVYTIYFKTLDGQEYRFYRENGKPILERVTTLPDGTVATYVIEKGKTYGGMTGDWWKVTVKAADGKAQYFRQLMVGNVAYKISGYSADFTGSALTYSKETLLKGVAKFGMTGNWLQVTSNLSNMFAVTVATTFSMRMSLSGTVFVANKLTSAFLSAATSAFSVEKTEARVYEGLSGLWTLVTKNLSNTFAIVAATDYSARLKTAEGVRVAAPLTSAFGWITGTSVLTLYSPEYVELPQLYLPVDAAKFPAVLKQYTADGTLLRTVELDASGKMVKVTTNVVSRGSEIAAVVHVYSNGQLYSEISYNTQGRMTRVMIAATGKAFRYEYTADSFDSRGRLVYYIEISEARENQGLSSSRSVWFDPSSGGLLAETSFEGGFSMYANRYVSGKLVARARIQSPSFVLRARTFTFPDGTSYNLNVPENAGAEIQKNTDVICSGTSCEFTAVEDGYYSTYEEYDTNGRIRLFKGGRTATDDAGAVGRHLYTYTLDSNGFVTKSVETFTPKTGTAEIITRYFLTPGQNTSGVTLVGHDLSFELAPSAQNNYQAVALPVTWNLFDDANVQSHLAQNGYGTLMALSRTGKDASGTDYISNSFFTYRLAMGSESFEGGAAVVSTERTVYKTVLGDGYYEERGNNYYNQYGDLTGQYVKKMNLASFAPPRALSSLPMELYDRAIVILERDTMGRVSRSSEVVRYQSNFVGGSWAPLAGLLREEILTELDAFNNPKSFEKQQFFIGSTGENAWRASERVKMYFAERANGQRVIGIERMPSGLLGEEILPAIAIVLDANGLPLGLEYNGVAVPALTNTLDHAADNWGDFWEPTNLGFPYLQDSHWTVDGTGLALVRLRNLASGLQGMKKLGGNSSYFALRDILFETVIDQYTPSAIFDNRTGTQAGQIPDSFFEVAAASARGFEGELPNFDARFFSGHYGPDGIWRDGVNMTGVYSDGVMDAGLLKTRIESFIITELNLNGGEGIYRILYEMAVRRAAVTFFLSQYDPSQDFTDEARSLLPADFNLINPLEVAAPLDAFKTGIAARKNAFVNVVRTAAQKYKDEVANQTDGCDEACALTHLKDAYASATQTFNGWLQSSLGTLNTSLDEAYEAFGPDEHGESYLYRYAPREALHFTMHDLNLRLPVPPEFETSGALRWDALAVDAELNFVDSALDRVKNAAEVSAQLFIATTTHMTTVLNETVLTFGSTQSDLIGTVKARLAAKSIEQGDTAAFRATLDGLIDAARSYQAILRNAQAAYQSVVRTALESHVDADALAVSFAHGGFVRADYGVTFKIHGSANGLEDILTGYAIERVTNFTELIASEYYEFWMAEDTFTASPTAIYSKYADVFTDGANQVKIALDGFLADYAGVRAPLVSLANADSLLRVNNATFKSLKQVFEFALQCGDDMTAEGIAGREAVYTGHVEELLSSIQSGYDTYVAALERIESTLCPSTDAGCAADIAVQGFKTALLLRKAIAVNNTLSQYREAGSILGSIYNALDYLWYQYRLADGEDYGEDASYAGAHGSFYAVSRYNGVVSDAAGFLARAASLANLDVRLTAWVQTMVASQMATLDGLAGEAAAHQSALSTALVGADDYYTVSGLANNILMMRVNFYGLAADGRMTGTKLDAELAYALDGQAPWNDYNDAVNNAHNNYWAAEEPLWKAYIAACEAAGWCGIGSPYWDNYCDAEAPLYDAREAALAAAEALNPSTSGVGQALLQAKNMAVAAAQDAFDAECAAILESYKNDSAMVERYLAYRYYDFYLTQDRAQALRRDVFVP